MSSDFVGQRLGRYQLVEEIGRGGMAVVYKAYHPALERHVAIKVLPRELSFDASFVERFQREARAAGSLNHPHIVTVHDVGRADDSHFIVMEFVDGPSLTELLERRGSLPSSQATSIVAHIASALDYAHARGFIHRDIKPGNILITVDGNAKLTDFGIVRPSEGTRLTQTGSLLGTPAYMSPEQARGGTIRPATDIYSLGIVTYELLSGAVPFSGGTVAVLHAHLYDPPDLRVLPGAAQPVVGKALAKDPQARYRTAGAFAEALRCALTARPTPPPPAQTPPPPPSEERSRRRVPLWIWGLGAVGFGMVLVGGIVVGVLAGALARSRPGTETSIPVTSGSTLAAMTQVATAAPQITPAATPSWTPERSSPSPTPRETVASTVTPTRDLALRWETIGWSVEGRELRLATIGEPAHSAVVVVGSIQGDQAGTRDLVSSLADQFQKDPGKLPLGVAFYFLPSLNPDGNAAASRFNANGVDLNRNWDAADWRSKAAVPGYEEGKAGAGGSAPFSEPETSAAADFIYALSSRMDGMTVVVIHSSVRRSTGEVYPGGGGSVDIAHRYASAAGYDVENRWAEYTTSGEMVTWCAEQGFGAIDVVIPGSQSPSSPVPGMNKTLSALTVDALLSMAGAPAH